MDFDRASGAPKPTKWKYLQYSERLMEEPVPDYITSAVQTPLSRAGEKEGPQTELAFFPDAPEVEDSAFQTQGLPIQVECKQMAPGSLPNVPQPNIPEHKDLSLASNKPQRSPCSKKQQRVERNHPATLATTDGKDALEKLSPELRNNIYEHVIADSRYERCSVGVCHGKMVPCMLPGKLPGIIFTSKGVRKETLSMYYKRTQIEMYLRGRPHDFRATADWLGGIVDETSKHTFSDVRLYLDDCVYPIRPHLATILPLLQFLRSTGLKATVLCSVKYELEGVRAQFRAQVGQLKLRGYTVFVIMKEAHKRMRNAVEVLCGLSRTAYEEEWTATQLKQEFEKQFGRLMRQASHRRIES